MSDLEEWRHENRGLALLLAADTLIRKKVYLLCNDKRKEFSTFSAALVEVLKNHKQLWNDARSSAEFKQAELDSTPARKRRVESPPLTPDKVESRTKRNRAKRERQKAMLKKAKEVLEPSKITLKPSKAASNNADRDKRISEAEWKLLASIKYTGRKRCVWFNCSLGCRFGDQCRADHVCLQCGGNHPYRGNH